MLVPSLVVLMLAPGENPKNIESIHEVSEDGQVQISSEGMVGKQPCAAICIQGSLHSCSKHGIRVRIGARETLNIPHDILRVAYIATNKFALEENPYLEMA